jgi:hypothetical protein
MWPQHSSGAYLPCAQPGQSSGRKPQQRGLRALTAISVRRRTSLGPAMTTITLDYESGFTLDLERFPVANLHALSYIPLVYTRRLLGLDSGRLGCGAHDGGAPGGGEGRLLSRLTPKVSRAKLH